MKYFNIPLIRNYDGLSEYVFVLFFLLSNSSGRHKILDFHIS